MNEIGESEWTEQRIKQLQVLKDIALKAIDFISQFEDELVRIWNKPKFVLNSNYVITLDDIIDLDLVRKRGSRCTLTDAHYPLCPGCSS
jgi:adenine specific DNA methylase Mod